MQSPLAGRLQASLSVTTCVVEQPQTAAVAVFGVGQIQKLAFDHLQGGRSDIVRPVEKPPRRPLTMLAMGARHVLGHGGEAAALLVLRKKTQALWEDLEDGKSNSESANR